MRIAWGVVGALVPLLAGIARADVTCREPGPFPQSRNYMSCAGFARYVYYRETGEWLSRREALQLVHAGTCAEQVCPTDGPPPPPRELRSTDTGLPAGVSWSSGTGLPAGISWSSDPRPFSRAANYMSLAGYRRWHARTGCCE